MVSKELEEGEKHTSGSVLAGGVGNGAAGFGGGYEGEGSSALVGAQELGDEDGEASRK